MRRKLLLRFYWLLSSQFGVDPYRTLKAFANLPHYFSDWTTFRRDYSGRLDLMPCLHDRFEEGGATKDEYFWQDLLVARWIFGANPNRHVDIGSRIDGFVAHVASFREIEIFDIRPVTAKIPGVVFRQLDLTRPDGLENFQTSYCDSLSCLHALEHFGLGRYGDPIDPEGHVTGMKNMLALLRSGGTFYLSVPIGLERVEFNANRVFDPRNILSLASENGLSLRQLTVINKEDVRESNASPDALAALARESYRLGLFVFDKK